VRIRALTTNSLFRLVLAAAIVVGAGVFAVGSVPRAAAAPNAIQVENAKPGTPGWDDFASVAQQDAISGFGSKISLNHGDSLDLYVTTTAPSFTINVYRTGWYGGVGARLVQSLGSFPGVHQAIPLPNATTGMVSCTGWTKTTTLNVPSDWVSGAYLAKLTASNGNASFIFFVVRNDGGHEAIDFQTSVTTYQAYNAWGGVSLYTNNTNKSSYRWDMGTKVSFDRPFDPEDSNGAGQFLYFEYPFIRWAESQGFDLTYTTDIDTHTNVNPLTNHKEYLSVGHDEYWSRAMRDNVTNAISQGVNAAFFSANTAYWQIRLEPNSLGTPNRVQVTYKDLSTFNEAQGPDPQYGVNNSIVTVRWRDAPVNQPENGLLGVMYQDQVNQNYSYVVQNSSNWIYAGTGFTDGTRIAGIVGYEYDKVWNNGFSPPGLTILSSSPVVGCCEGSGASTANSTLYTKPGGGQVFASGTIQWSWGLDNYSATFANAGIQKTTANILNAFSSGSAPSSPAVTLAPTSLAFGNQRVGSSTAPQNVTLTNSGNAALTVNGISVTGTNSADFGQTNTCPIAPSTLAAGSSCSISVTFTPGAAGSRSASLSISDNATGSPHTLALTGTGTAPAVGLNPSSLTFAGRTVGTTSASQSSTLTNSGTAPLTISAIVMAGTNPGDFAQVNNCPLSPATLGVGASCSIQVTFTPTATGSRSASVSVTDDATGSPHSLGVSGTGLATAPDVGLNPTSLDFGARSVGSTSAAQSSTLTNTGNAALNITGVSITGTNAGDFAQTNNCPSSLGAGASCSISVTFTPGAAGARSASVSIADDATSSPQSIALTGSGQAPAVTLTPTSLSYGSQLVGTTSGSQSSTLRNSGTGPLTITSIELAGTNAGDFGQTNNCPVAPLTLAVNATCTLTVTFSPTASGPRSASVSIADDAAGSPHSLGLSGTGTQPAPAVTLNPTSLSFGNQRVATSSANQSVTVSNTGTAPLSISSIGVSGANAGDFAQGSDCPTVPGTLAAGGSCTIQVSFTPSATGSRTASVSIADDASGNPHTVSLSGTGTAPAVTLTPASLTFSGQTVGTTSPTQSVTVRNSGTAGLAISSIALGGTNAGDFGQSNNCPTVPSLLAANATCTVTVSFTPSALGSRTASVNITDDASGSPHGIALSGTGAAPGAIALDKSLGTKSDNVGSNNITINTSGAAVAGSRVFAFVNWNQSTRTLTSVTGGGLTWTIDVQAKATNGNTRSAIASAPAPSGLPTNTQLKATFSGSVTHGLMSAASFTGIAAASPLDGTTSNTQAGVVGWTCSVTTTNPSDLVLGWSGIDANATSVPTAPSLELQDFGDANYYQWSTTDYRIESSAGAKTVNGTWSRNTAATSNLTLCAAYKAG
jgi:hypothetical protein